MSDRFHHASRHMVSATMDARRKPYSMATNVPGDDDEAAVHIVPSSPLVMPGAPRLRPIPLPYVPAESHSGYATPPLSPVPSPTASLLPLPSWPQDSYPLPQYTSGFAPSWQIEAGAGTNSLGLTLPLRDAPGPHGPSFWNNQESYWPNADSNYDEAGSSRKPLANSRHRISRPVANKETGYEGADEWDQVSESEGELEEVRHVAHRVRHKRPAESSTSFRRGPRRST